MLQKMTRFQSRLKQIAILVKTGLRTVVPCPCQLCGAENPHTVCTDCQRQFFSETVPRCLRCAIPLNNDDSYCGQCTAEAPAFARTITACDYRAPLDQLVLALKFRHQLWVAAALAQRMADAAGDWADADLLMPVPLSRERLRQRGFNQSLEIARPLAGMLNIPLCPQLLHRVRDTTPQTLLPLDQRRANILHAFAPDEATRDKIQGRHIGVVDDVMTTGSTLNEIAACLKRHGADQVSNLIFARTPPH